MTNPTQTRREILGKIERHLNEVNPMLFLLDKDISALQAVAQAAEALHAANQREAGAVAMGCYWSALEDALNAWRAAK